MTGEIIKDSIEIKKLEKPIIIGGKKHYYEISYLTYPYGTKSPMRKREKEFALDMKDAEEWKKVLLKEVI
jgi:hypothetical protein